jgi:hypothetical protein
MVKIKRETRFALCIEERLLFRTRESGDKNGPAPGPPAEAIQGGAVSKYQEKKDLTPCKDK